VSITPTGTFPCTCAATIRGTITTTATTTITTTRNGLPISSTSQSAVEARPKIDDLHGHLDHVLGIDELALLWYLSLAL
jgi:hypothetical protein